MGKFLAGLGVGVIATALVAGFAMTEQERAHQAEIAAMDALMTIQTELFKTATKKDRKDDK